MYWEPEKECMGRDELEQIQIERLQATLHRVYSHVPFYRRKFDAMGILPEDVGSLSDLARLPFTTKDDVRGNYPYGLFAVPLREVVRIHSSSGATGTAAVVGYTRNDIKTWSNLAARVLAAAGVTKDDVIQIAFGYGLFTGGLGFHYGAERVGASVIPASSGNTARQIKIMRDYKTTALVCSPSYALFLVETMRKMELPPSALSLKYGLFGSEPWSEKTRQSLQDSMGILATDNYGLSEVMGPGVSGECPERNGLHISEDHFLVELIDPDTLAPAPPGGKGELVITTLTKEAFPMIRYRTRDLTILDDGPCPCGRTGRRMRRVLGRTDEMVIIKGVKVFPSQVESILAGLEGPDPRYRIVIDRKEAMDEVVVQVEDAEGVGVERRHAGRMEAIRKRLTQELGISVEVSLVERDSLGPAGRKQGRVLDKRGM